MSIDLSHLKELRSREETTFAEVARRIREGDFYEDYDWASGPALRAIDRTEALIEQNEEQARRIGVLEKALEPFMTEIDRLERDYGFDRPLHQGRMLMLPLSDLLRLRSALKDTPAS